MWWVKANSTGEERGGFQNRDVGKTSFNYDYGPEFGVDYARFADPPDIAHDLELKKQLIRKIGFTSGLTACELTVKNGFVIAKGFVPDEETRREILEILHSEKQVREVISDLKIERSA